MNKKEQGAHLTSDTQQSSKSHGKPDNVFVTQALTF